MYWLFASARNWLLLLCVNEVSMTDRLFTSAGKISGRKHLKEYFFKRHTVQHFRSHERPECKPLLQLHKTCRKGSHRRSSPGTSRIKKPNKSGGNNLNHNFPLYLVYAYDKLISTGHQSWINRD